MGRVEYYAAASLDGYIADADDGINWLTSYEGSYDGPGMVPMEGTYDDFFAGIGALVMGSATYKFLLDHMAAGNEWMYPGTPSWVLSSREWPAPDAAAADVRFASGPIPELAPAMIASAGEKALWVVGGGGIASEFAALGLLDTVIVTVVPVVLGSGKPLFEAPLLGPALKLAGSRAFDSGMVELRYEMLEA